MAKNLQQSMNGLPFILKLLLVIFFGFAYGAIYRIARLDLFGIIFGILWLCTAGFFGIGWIIDLVTVILCGKPTFFA